MTKILHGRPFHRGFNLIFLAVIIFLAVLFFGCGGSSSSGEGSPADDEDFYQPVVEYEIVQTIGPNGGTIEVTDPESAYYGIRINVPEGSLLSKAVISISTAVNPPSLPKGFKSPRPQVKLQSNIDFTQDVQITFPIDTLPEQLESILGALHYDESANTWRLIFPRDIDYDTSQIFINTTHFSIWSWGFFLLTHDIDDIAFDIIENAVTKLIGEDTIESVASESQEVWDEV